MITTGPPLGRGPSCKKKEDYSKKKKNEEEQEKTLRRGGKLQKEGNNRTELKERKKLSHETPRSCSCHMRSAIGVMHRVIAVVWRRGVLRGVSLDGSSLWVSASGDTPPGSSRVSPRIPGTPRRSRDSAPASTYGRLHRQPSFNAVFLLVHSQSPTARDLCRYPRVVVAVAVVSCLCLRLSSLLTAAYPYFIAAGLYSNSLSSPLLLARLSPASVAAYRYGGRCLPLSLVRWHGYCPPLSLFASAAIACLRSLSSVWL